MKRRHFDLFQWEGKISGGWFGDLGILIASYYMCNNSIYRPLISMFMLGAQSIQQRFGIDWLISIDPPQCFGSSIDPRHNQVWAQIHNTQTHKYTNAHTHKYTSLYWSATQCFGSSIDPHHNLVWARIHDTQIHKYTNLFWFAMMRFGSCF